MIFLLTLLGGCQSTCIDDDLCRNIPEIPWDPGASPLGGEGYGGDGDTETVPDREILTKRDCEVTLKHKPPQGVAQTQVAGDFNNWAPADLGAPDSDGFQTVNLGVLAPGHYPYKYVYDGNFEDQPPINVYTEWSGGSENRSLVVGDCDKPLLQTVSAGADGSGNLWATIQFASAADEVALDQVTVTAGNNPVSADFDPVTGEIEVNLTGLAPGKHSLRVWATDSSGRNAENEPLFIPLWVEDEPFEWADGYMYFVFTDRFRNGDWGGDLYDPVNGVAECANYQGGDFQGVIDALNDDYFTELGVNTLWLSPVYENPEGGYLGTDGVNSYTGYHGYWPTDPLGIESRFGDANGSGAEKLDEMIELAHSKGIRVLFDLVLNHVHEDHTYIDEHTEWFGPGCVCGTQGCGWDDKPVECWFTDYLPDLDYQQHDLTLQVLEDTLRLVELHDVDAVRVDAAKHMDHVIMRSLNMRIRDEFEVGGGAEFYIVGETFVGGDGHGLIMDYVNDVELDGQFDFPLYYSIRDAFAYGGSFRDLENMVATGEAAYGDYLMSPFLGNHDIERFASAVTGVVGDYWNGQYLDPMANGGNNVTQWDLINRMTLGFAFTLTQPGVPLIYYGDEIGLHGGHDPDNRRMMNFEPYLSENQRTLRERIAVIGQARASSKALRRGDRVQLWVDDDLLVYALDNGGGDVAIVALNKGGARNDSITVDSLGVEGVEFTDAISGAQATVSGGQLQLPMGSWEHRILLVTP